LIVDKPSIDLEILDEGNTHNTPIADERSSLSYRFQLPSVAKPLNITI